MAILLLTYHWRDPSDGDSTMQGKQAKIVSPTQERAILGYLATTRYPSRDRVVFLLSMKAGLRAKEMASLTWRRCSTCQTAPVRATLAAAHFPCTPAIQRRRTSILTG